MNPSPTLPLAASLLLLLPGCSSAPGPGGTAGDVPACCQPAHALPAPDRFTDKSLYQSEGLWTTDRGEPVHLGALGGRPQVVAMFFASCKFTCPIIVQDMRRIEAALSPQTRARVGFTLVSFDSRRDSPAALAAYRQARKLPTPAWTLLRGEPDDVLELAALLGVSFKEDARGDFSHSNQIAVLDADGELVQRLEGLNMDVAGTVALLEQLAAGR